MTDPAFVDLHSHFLPGLDDGARSLDETVAMLHCAWQQGTRTIAATPHMFSEPYGNCEPARVRDRFSEIVRQLSEPISGATGFLHEMNLLLGAENYLSTELLIALESRRVVTIGDGVFLLVEFSPYLAPPMIEEGMQRILASGLVPLIAHVERYRQFVETPECLERLVARGCVGQVNAEALDGRCERALRKRAFAYLKNGLAQIVASDGHSPRARTTGLGAAAKWLRRRASVAQVELWMCKNPARIVRGDRLANA